MAGGIVRLAERVWEYNVPVPPGGGLKRTRVEEKVIHYDGSDTMCVLGVGKTLGVFLGDQFTTRVQTCITSSKRNSNSSSNSSGDDSSHTRNSAIPGVHGARLRVSYVVEFREEVGWVGRGLVARGVSVGLGEYYRNLESALKDEDNKVICGVDGVIGGDIGRARGTSAKENLVPSETMVVGWVSSHSIWCIVITCMSMVILYLILEVNSLKIKLQEIKQ
jgi:hypothetical protein